MPQEFKQKQTQRSSDTQDEVLAEAPVQDRTLSDDVEEILGDIDDLLEENAQEFVANYVQKGGQ